MNNKQRVFISYSYNDRAIASTISRHLKYAGINVASNVDDIQLGHSYFEEIKYLYEVSDIVIILLSDSLFRDDKFSLDFFRFYFDEARKRKVIIIPALVDKCRIPDIFLEFEIINLTTNFEKGLDKIVEKLKVIPKISFENFSSRDFEEFTYDLLIAYGFKNIEKEFKVADRGVDFICEQFSTNPFGIRKRETWLVYVKYYKEDRFSISAIKRLTETHSYIGKENPKILLITNGLLTSAAEKYLEDIKKRINIDIDVLDGLTLKKLVSGRKKLLNKYFLR